MKGFLTRLLDRHMIPGNNVSPQVRGRYEPEFSFRTTPIITDTEQVVSSGLVTQHRKNAEMDELKKIQPGSVPGIKSPPPSTMDNEDPMLNRAGSSGRKEKPIGPHGSATRETSTAYHKITGPVETLTNNAKTNVPDGKEKAVRRREHWVDDAVRTPHTDLVTGEAARQNTPDQLYIEPVTTETKQDISLKVEPVRYRSEIRDPVNNQGGQLKPPEWLGAWKGGQKPEGRMNEVKPPEETTIKVNIGRIEVRAVMQPTPIQPLPRTEPKPGLSLEDYLKQRDGGKK